MTSAVSDPGQAVAAPARPVAWSRLEAARPAITGAAVAVVAIVVLSVLDGSYTGLTITIGLGYGIVTTGMVVQIGYSRQLAFSQSVFMAFGGYGIGLLEVRYGFSSAEAVVAVLAVALVASALIGSLLTRAAGIALAVATMMPAVFLYILATSSDYLGAFTGLVGINPLVSAASYRASLVESGVLTAVLLGLVVAVCVRVMRSGVGLQLMALASGDSLAESVGVGLRQRRVEIFVLGSVTATLGGAVVTAAQGIVSPNLISQSAEIGLLLMLFIAGRKSVIAAICGAVVIEYLLTSSAWISTNLPTIEGVALLVVLIVQPDGAARLVQLGWQQVARSGAGRQFAGRFPG